MGKKASEAKILLQVLMEETNFKVHWVLQIYSIDKEWEYTSIFKSNLYSKISMVTYSENSKYYLDIQY